MNPAIHPHTQPTIINGVRPTCPRLAAFPHAECRL
jgi:hypothetical protein